MDELKSATSLARRKRGAQPGNTNALKHGLYSRSFRKVELADLELLASGLENEIAMLRVLQRRVFSFGGDFDQAGSGEDRTALQAEANKLLDSLSSASVRVAKLMQIHKELTGNTSAISAALDAALDRAAKRMGLE